MSLDAQQYWSYTLGMKTAISLPKDVFEKAERLAMRARKSRSQLYCDALREYVARHSPDEITEALDRAIAEDGQPEARFAALASAQTLERVEW
jgi:predicted transcriptional regulator